MRTPLHTTARLALAGALACPAATCPLRDAGIFWPELSDPPSRLTGVYPFPSSDHRLVWVDVKLAHRVPR